MLSNSTGDDATIHPYIQCFKVFGQRVTSDDVRNMQSEDGRFWAGMLLEGPIVGDLCDESYGGNLDERSDKNGALQRNIHIEIKMVVCLSTIASLAASRSKPRA